MCTVDSCYLKCENNSHDPILLPHRQNVIVGRSTETNIDNLRCSRKQVSLTANYESQEVVVKHEGQTPSCVDGVVLTKNQYYMAHDNSIVELLPGILRHKVQFILKGQENIAKKSLSRVDQNSNKRIKLDTPSTSMTGWNEVGSLLIYTSSGVVDREKIAAFDMDGTLIKTKSGHTFPVNSEDWKIIYNVVKAKLEELFKNGYKIVVFTNQAAIGNGRVNIPDFKTKIEAILKELSVPIQVFISTARDIYRKPAPGMWNHLSDNSSVPIKLEECMYIGDAAGRIANWEPGRKKDFSISDRMFASNIGLNFCTPEEFFLGRPKVPFDSPSFIPSVFEADSHNHAEYDIPSSEQEVIIMVGAPGSGKSHFVRDYIIPEGYISISRDVLNSWQKCVASLESAIQKKHNCVIDNTNPDVESRKRYIDVCKQHKIKVRCFVMSTSIERCHHNNTFREIRDKRHAPVSPIIINKFSKNYVQPTLEEGFDKIIEVPFVPDFDSPSEENLYKMYLFSK